MNREKNNTFQSDYSSWYLHKEVPSFLMENLRASTINKPIIHSQVDYLFNFHTHFFDHHRLIPHFTPFFYNDLGSPDAAEAITDIAHSYYSYAHKTFIALVAMCLMLLSCTKDKTDYQAVVDEPNPEHPSFQEPPASHFLLIAFG